MELTQELLKKYLHYDLDTGIFTWSKKKSFTMGKGTLAGYWRVDGYLIIVFDYKVFYAHRLAFLYVKGYFPENVVDHIDGDVSNNRWNNLREVSETCNKRNRKINHDNKSGVSGVHWNEQNQRWIVSIGVSGKRCYLGSFSDFHEAVLIRYEAEIACNYNSCLTQSPAVSYLVSNNILKEENL